MNFSAIYHRTSDNYCYPLNENQLIINLKTGYDVKQVFLWYGDPFATGILGSNDKFDGERIDIPFKKRLKNHIWWTTTVEPEYKRCRYFFELVSNEGDTYFYFEDGILTQHEKDISGKMLQCFTFPWLNKSDINVTPNWVNSTVWYQIFPERFANGNPNINSKYVQPWREGKVTNEDRFGGDLQGIINKLDYIENLGINGIYLTPIFKADTTHKYDTIDYMEIDPEFGDKETFRELVDKLHSRGMRIMLDGVFNHCGNLNPMWQDVLENGPKSKYFDWFMINKWPFDKERPDTKDKSFYSFAFTAKMPKLNTNNIEVIEYILSVCEYWVREFDIDGIRLDVANEISHKLCKVMRERLKAIKPDIYILGEIWHDSIKWLLGDEFDAVMNYPLTNSIADFWLNKELTKEDAEYTINRCYTMYMQQTNDVVFNLLDSHDTPRLINRVKNIDIFYQQLAVLYTMPGSPCIFYGTEVALEGGADPDCRRCMPWEKIEAGYYDERINTIKQLIKLRKEDNAFKGRNFHFPNTIKNKRVMEYIKLDEYGNDETEIILNCSDEDVSVKAGGKILFSRLYENDIIKPNGILIRKNQNI